MRRASALLVLILAAGLAALPPAASATIIGDPTYTVGQGRVAAAAEVDLGISGDVETNRFWLRGDYGFSPNVDGFLRLGFFDGDIDPGNGEIDGYGFGGGVRLDLVQQKDWHFGGLAQIMYNTGEVEISIPILGTFEEDVDWFEIDLAGAASYRGAGPVVPYFGAKIGYITGDDPVDDDLGFTLFGGANYAITPALSVGGELRIIDDDALGFFVRYRF